MEIFLGLIGMKLITCKANSNLDVIISLHIFLQILVMVRKKEEMYFIFGSIIGGLPSNYIMGDMKNCLSRCNEPDHIFKSSEPLCSVYMSHQWRTIVFVHHRPFICTANACYLI